MFDIIDNKIYLSRGDSCEIDITIKDDEGDTYNLKSGESLLFSLKKITDQCKTILTKEFESISGDLIIRFDEDDTINLAFGEYVYDVILISGGDVYTIIEPTLFTIAEVVHNGIE